jgi:hypothetical protein
LSQATAGPRSPNTLSTAEVAAGWRLLFDGRSFAGWRGLGYDTVPTHHWRIAHGTIERLPSAEVTKPADGRPDTGGDLMTVETFQDFELVFDWRVGDASNSGVKYNVSEELSLKHGSDHAALGFEYQILDDSLAEDNVLPSHRAGALYDLVAPNDLKRVAPVGQWNTGRIVLRGNHGEHWLNGKKILDFDLGTPAMDSTLASSKYRSIIGFAERRAGHIVLQDHDGEVYYRDVKVRVLP